MRGNGAEQVSGGGREVLSLRTKAQREEGSSRRNSFLEEFAIILLLSSYTRIIFTYIVEIISIAILFFIGSELSQGWKYSREVLREDEGGGGG